MGGAEADEEGDQVRGLAGGGGDAGQGGGGRDGPRARQFVGGTRGAGRADADQGVGLVGVGAQGGAEGVLGLVARRMGGGGEQGAEGGARLGAREGTLGEQIADP